MRRVHLLPVMAVLLPAVSCGLKEGYPDLGEVPERPQPTLTEERAEEVSEGLRTAREEAVRQATEGRADEEEAAEPEGEEETAP